MRRLCAGVSVVCLVGLHAVGGSRISAAQRRDDGPRTASAGELIISEFRLRGPNGPNDEFIEIYNASGGPHTVAAVSGTGYGIAASDGTTRCTIPNGTVIPNRGHFLCASSNGYSLGAYPAGNGTTATGDATFTTDIPDNAGIAIFNNNSGGGSYSVANLSNAVGSTSESNDVRRHRYPALTPTNGDARFTREPAVGAPAAGDLRVDAMQTTLDRESAAGGYRQQRQRLHVRHPNGGALGAAHRRAGAGASPRRSRAARPGRRGSTRARRARRANRCAIWRLPARAPFGTLDLRRTWTNTSGDDHASPSGSWTSRRSWRRQRRHFRPRSSGNASVTVVDHRAAPVSATSCRGRRSSHPFR